MIFISLLPWLVADVLALSPWRCHSGVPTLHCANNTFARRTNVIPKGKSLSCIHCSIRHSQPAFSYLLNPSIKFDDCIPMCELVPFHARLFSPARRRLGEVISSPPPHPALAYQYAGGLILFTLPFACVSDGVTIKRCCQTSPSAFKVR